jgi:hypothetical protein
MGETSDQIVKQIRETRSDLSDNINELEDKVKTAIDWRAQFEENPGTVLGAAFVGGALLSALIPTMRGSHGVSGRGPRNGDWSIPDARAAKSRETATSEAKRPSETLSAVKIALVGLAASRLTNYINDLLPGFEHEFSKARSGQKNPDWAR